MSSFPASVVVTAFSGPEVAERLTDKMAQAAAPRARRYVIRDAQVPGLSLRVGRRSKVWIIRVRFGCHASRRVLGRFPTIP